MNSRQVWMVCSSQDVERSAKILPLWRAQGYMTLVLQHTRAGNPDADLAVWSDQDLGNPAAFNYILDRVLPASAELVVLGSDCLVPEQSFSARELAEDFFARFPDGFGAMQPLHGNDNGSEARPTCASPFLGRGWIERAYGGYGALHTRYAQYFADVELYWVTKSLSVMWERLDIRHTIHPELARPAEAFSRYRASDLALLRQRVRMGFPGCHPSGSLGAIHSQVLQDAQMAIDTLTDQCRGSARVAA